MSPLLSAEHVREGEVQVLRLVGEHATELANNVLREAADRHGLLQRKRKRKRG